MTRHPNLHRRVIIVISLLIVSSFVISGVRLYRMNFDLGKVLPQRIYTVSVDQSFVGHGMPVDLGFFLPQEDVRQQIVKEQHDGVDMVFESYRESENRKGKWRSDRASGPYSTRYTVTLATKAMRYEMSRTSTMADVMTTGGTDYLASTDVIQSDSTEIIDAARRRIPADGTAYSFLKNAFSFVSKMKFKPFKGTTDALTALRLGEASCNGRSRLLVAMLRSQKIAARLVGGLVMNSGEKKTSHQWVEVRINNTWVPLDPTNNHFMEIPHHYLVLYRGDESLLKHTSDIGFKYRFVISKKMVPAQEISEDAQFAGVSHVFRSMGIPMGLLKSIIMIPLAALIVVLFRNVIGMHTFGTFLPALMAIAFKSTGIVWGIIGFTIIILAVSLLRQGLSRLQLLHSPQLGVMLTVVIGLFLTFAMLGAQFSISELAKVSLFPMVLVSITAERFSITEIEEGRLEAWKIMGQTLVVVSMAYVVMRSLSFQVIMLSFPELLLIIAALNIWIGRWVGLRASEWLRFRQFIRTDNTGVVQ